jgi:hypothetical protein
MQFNNFAFCYGELQSVTCIEVNRDLCRVVCGPQGVITVASDSSSM